MELDQPKMVWKTEVTLMGTAFGVEVFTRDNGKSFALTRYTPEDIFITDGRNEEDALIQHSLVLPLAVGCRKRRDMIAAHELQNCAISYPEAVLIRDHGGSRIQNRR